MVPRMTKRARMPAPPPSTGTATSPSSGAGSSRTLRRMLPALAAAAPLTALAACGGAADDPRRSEARSRAPLEQRMASADPNRGKRLFGQCASCHTIAPGGGDRNGPNLHALVGRRIAAGSARFGYTAALSSKGGSWTPKRLDAWISNPQAFAPGTSMVYPGMANGVDRADLIAFLAQQR